MCILFGLIDKSNQTINEINLLQFNVYLVFRSKFPYLIHVLNKVYSLNICFTGIYVNFYNRLRLNLTVFDHYIKSPFLSQLHHENKSSQYTVSLNFYCLQKIFFFNFFHIYQIIKLKVLLQHLLIGLYFVLSFST